MLNSAHGVIKMQRRPTPFILLTLCGLLCPTGQAADLPGELLPLMNVPDRVAYESDFSRQETIRKRKKGNWQSSPGKPVGRSLMVCCAGKQSSPEYQAEKPDHKGREPRIASLKTPQQFVAKFSVRFIGGEETKLVPLIEFGHHNVRLKFSANGIALLSDHETVRLAESSDVKFESGRWYHLLAEKNGDEFVVQFAGGPTLYGRHRSLTESKTSGESALNIAGPRGGVVEIDNVTLWTIKPENAPSWSTVRGGLPTTTNLDRFL